MRSLERALCGAGYRVDETLHYFAYDWRLRIVDLGAALAAEVRRIAERTGGPIDMLGLSNGGPMIRAAFAADRALPVERVVTSGGPHGGAVETLACLDRGFQFAPLGRTVSPQQFMACPGALQAIPSPALAKFVVEGDAGGGESAAEGRRRPLRRRDLAPVADVRVPARPRRSCLGGRDGEAAGRHARDVADPRRRAGAAAVDRASAAPGSPRRSPSSCARAAPICPARAAWPASRPPRSPTATGA